MQKAIFLYIVAILLWWQGFRNTDNFLVALGSASFWSSLITQIALSAIQSPIWDGKAQWWNWSALAADVYINFGGMYTPASRLEATPSWQASTSLLSMLNDGRTLDVGVLDNVMFALITSAAIAIGAEIAWRQAGGWSAFRRRRTSEEQ